MHIHSCAHTYKHTHIHRDIQTRPTGTRTNTETRVNTEESEHIKDVDIQQTAFTNTRKGKTRQNDKQAQGQHERASIEIETNKFLKLVLGHQFFPDV